MASCLGGLGLFSNGDVPNQLLWGHSNSWKAWDLRKCGLVQVEEWVSNLCIKPTLLVFRYLIRQVPNSFWVYYLSRWKKMNKKSWQHLFSTHSYSTLHWTELSPECCSSEESRYFVILELCKVCSTQSYVWILIIIRGCLCIADCTAHWVWKAGFIHSSFYLLLHCSGTDLFLYHLYISNKSEMQG